VASSSADTQPEVMRFGQTPQRGATPQCRIILATSPEGTLRAILKQAGITPDDFLQIE
jgi:hypothetical protein